MADIFDQLSTGSTGDIFDQLSSSSSTPKDVGEIRAYKPTLGGNIKDALIGGAFGNVFLRNNPDIENEKRRQLLSSLTNTATLGIPQAIAKGIQMPMAKVQAPTQELIGNTLGLVSPGGIANTASKAIKGAGIGAKALRGVIAGGVGGALLPQDTLKQRLESGKIGATIGGGLSLVTSIAPKLINLGGKKTAQMIAQKADKGFDALSEELGKKYDTLFSKVKGTASVDEISQSIANTLDEYPQAANSGKIGKMLDRLSEFKKTGKDLTASELNNLKQEVRSTIPRGVWNGTVDPDAMQNAKMDIYWKINDKLSQLGGDEYKALNQEYRNFKQSEKLARKFFYEQGQVSDANVGKSISKTGMDAIKRLSSQLPNEKQFAQDFTAWRRGQMAKKIAVGGGVLTLGDYLVRRRLGGLLGGSND